MAPAGPLSPSRSMLPTCRRPVELHPCRMSHVACPSRCCCFLCLTSIPWDEKADFWVGMQSAVGNAWGYERNLSAHSGDAYLPTVCNFHTKAREAGLDLQGVHSRASRWKPSLITAAFLRSSLAEYLWTSATTIVEAQTVASSELPWPAPQVSRLSAL